MRRLIIFFLLALVFVAAACNGDDNGGNGDEVGQQPTETPVVQVTPSNTVDPNQPLAPTAARSDSEAPTLPPQATVDRNATPTPNVEIVATATFGQRIVPGAATLPPTFTATPEGAATGDTANSTGQPSNGNNTGNPSGVNTPNTSGGGPASATPRTIEGAPTLPPRFTSTPLPTTVTAPPTIRPTVAPTLPPVEIPPYCETFRGDEQRNAATYNILVGDPVTIYWYPVNGTGYKYLVQLFAANGTVLFSTIIEDERSLYEYQFPTEFVDVVGTYFWSVTAYVNTVNDADCPAIDDEIFVRQQ